MTQHRTSLLQRFGATHVVCKWLVRAVVLALTLSACVAGSGEALSLEGSASTTTPGVEQPDVVAGEEQGRMRVFADLDNVDNAIFAFDTVWAVTSRLSDNFSAGPADATLIRIDPSTGETTTVLDGLGAQPTLALLNDRVWAKLEDRIVAFDASGAEVASLPWEADGDMVAGDSYIWVADFHEAQVIAIDPSSTEVLRAVETDQFPVTPIVAFEHVWIPSVTGGTVTIIDEETLGDTTSLAVFVTSGRQSEVTAVPGGATGNEVWAINVEGELFAIGADAATLGEVRDIPVEKPVNKVVVQDDRVVLLPIGGVSVVIADLATGQTLAQIPIDSIPYRGVTVGSKVWITSDGSLEALTLIDPQALSLVEQFQIGTNESNTTGPTQPFSVRDEIWVANRGDDAIFAVTQAVDS